MNKIDQVIQALKKGQPIVLVDDRDRENEGDLVFPAEIITEEVIAFMMVHCRGLICLAITEARRQELGLNLQVVHNESVFGTNFAVPFDHSDFRECGITAAGRAGSIKKAAQLNINKENFISPGFVVPVVARDGGVLRRRGQTEGSVDLSRLAGFDSSAVICEIIGEDGEPLRGNPLDEFCTQHDLISCSIDELVKFRLSLESNIRLVADKPFQLEKEIRENLIESLIGDKFPKNLKCDVKVFVDDVDNSEHFALCFGEYSTDDVLCRLHSECLTGDVFGSVRCDCGKQLDLALSTIIEKRSGILLYLQQEGRGIGLANKIKAYELQENGLDTFEANEFLGFLADARDYRVASQILKVLGIKSVNLMTNNPAKISGLKEAGIIVTSRIPLQVPSSPHNENYIKAKIDKMGHLFDL